MGISKRITTFLFIISLLNLIPYPSHAAVVPNNAARIKIRGPKLSASDANSKNPNRVDPKRDCGEMGSRSECTQNTTCRWCRSNALDDMCFSKSEASRLPPQVFSCEFWYGFLFVFLFLFRWGYLTDTTSVMSCNLDVPYVMCEELLSACLSFSEF